MRFKNLICYILVFLLLLNSISIETTHSSVYTYKRDSLLLSSKATVEILQFNVVALSPYSVSLNWKLSFNSSSLFIKVIRHFIVFESVIAILPSRINNFTDTWVEFGTQYSYEIVVIHKDGTVVAHSEIKTVVTPVDTNYPGAPKYNWTYYKQVKYNFFPEDYLQYDTKKFTTFRYYLHGVNVTIAFDENLSPSPSLSFMRTFANYVFVYFHRHWTVYRSFPLDEYRIVIRHDASTISEDELGLQYGDDIVQVGFGERLSHEIGHAWIGGILKIERNFESFDPETEDSDKWILEGFEHFYGIIQLNLSETISMLTHDISYYRDTMLGTNLDKPLVDLPVYFGTQYAYTYYCKGGLVAYLINKILIESDNKTLNDFMRHLYRKYNITTDDNWAPKLISTEDLLEELNTFSNYNFTEFFEKYVYGIEELPVTEIESQYIEAIQNFSEVISMKVDMVPPWIKILSPLNNTITRNTTMTIRWEGYDIGSGVSHYEIRLDDNEWINVNKSTQYTFTNLIPGEHVIYITVKDKLGNTNTTTILVTVQAIEYEILYLVGGIAAAIIVSVVLFLVRKKS